MKTRTDRWMQLGLSMGLSVACLIAGAQAESEIPSLPKATIAPLVKADRSDAPDRTEELQRLVNSVSPGGIVRIPAGCYRVRDVVYVAGGKQIIGEGNDKTILYRSGDEARNHQGGIFTFTVPKMNNETPNRVSGIAFIGVQDAANQDKDGDFGITLNDASDFRIDHCYFEGFGWAGVKVKGKARGVIDHCIFVDNYKESLRNMGYGVVVYGANEWAEDPQLGTTEATVVEDCYFSGNRHSIASNAGAHYVFRHNRVQHGVAASALDVHGPGYGSKEGTRSVEVYENVFDEPLHKWCGIGIRGGEGVIFKNTIKDYNHSIYLFLEFDMSPEMKTQYPARQQVQNLWIWDNEIINGPAEIQIADDAVNHIKDGRDFFTKAKPGYEPLEYPHPLLRAETAQ